MQPDAVQTRNKPFECRVILLCALNLLYIGFSYRKINPAVRHIIDNFTQICRLCSKIIYNALRFIHYSKILLPDYGMMTQGAALINTE
jgi:hypothetical protein